jgi:hypothetical protein
MIILQYIKIFFERRAARKVWRKIQKDYTPEEIVESFVFSMPYYPHQQRKRRKEITRMMQEFRKQNAK